MTNESSGTGKTANGSQRSQNGDPSEELGRDGEAKAKKNSRPASIDEALRMLDEALVNTSVEMKNRVADEYRNVHSAVQSTIAAVSSHVQTYGGVASESAEKFAHVAKETTERIVEEGLTAGRETLKKVDTEVRANPWPYIGGVAVGTFVLGVLFGSRQNNNPSDKT